MKSKIVNIILVLLSLAGTLTALSHLPDVIPVHFDIYGIADRWGSKYEMLTMPGVMLAMLAFWFGVEGAYKKKISSSVDEKEIAEAKVNMKVIDITSVITSLLFTVITGVVLYTSYSQLDGADATDIDFLKIISILMGVAFILLGNYMPKAKNNSTVGFRLPWTRYNDITWSKSNRFASYAMVIYGVIIAVCGIILNGIAAMIVMLSTLFVTLIILIVYAYIIYRKEVKKNND